MNPDDPKSKQKTHTEHLNYVCMIDDVQEPTIISFCRASWKIGKDFARRIQIRKAPIFGCRFQAIVGDAVKDDNSWHVFNIIDPIEGEPWVDPKNVESFQKIFEGLNDAYLKRTLVADYETPDVRTVESHDVPF